MTIKLLDRPLCVYYLWKISKDFFYSSEKNSEQLTSKQAIGQLKAERKNLEKMDDILLGNHILCLSYLEELLKNSSEESFQLVVKEVHKKVNRDQILKEKNGVWGMPQK